jgi:antitoxin (DNA-binding transcriptional repressor) of toxin-antitoxin stability system
MNVYTYAEARQNLATLLDKAEREGEVLIKRKDGRVFVVKPQPRTGSPLAVEGVDLDITTPEIVEFVQEGRRVSGL